MPKQSIDDQIRGRIDTFVEELSSLIRESALEAVGEALGNGAAAAPSHRKAARKQAAGRKTGKRTARPKTAKKKSSGKRVRRSADDIAKMGDRVLAYVKANAGTRMEAIAKALRKETKDLRRSVQDLIAAKKLRTKGQKRGTEYYAGAGRGGAKKKTARKAKKKTARRKAKRKTKRATKKKAA